MMKGQMAEKSIFVTLYSEMNPNYARGRLTIEYKASLCRTSNKNVTPQ